MDSYLREMLSTLSLSTCRAFLFPAGKMVDYDPAVKVRALIVWKLFVCRGYSYRIKNAKMFSYLGSLILTQFSRVT